MPAAMDFDSPVLLLTPQVAVARPTGGLERPGICVVSVMMPTRTVHMAVVKLFLRGLADALHSHIEM